MQRAAQIWLVYTITNSPLLLGLLGVAQSGPVLVFSLFAGALVDRLPKRKLIIATQVIMTLQALALAALTWSGTVKYWHVLVLASILGITQTLDMPGRQSFFIEMVGKEDLMNAISLNSTIVNLAKVLGPSLAGVAMAKLGPSWCFLFNGLSFIAVIWGLILIDVGNTKPEVKSRNMLKDVGEGLQFMWKNEALRSTAVTLAIFAIFLVNHTVIIPVYVTDTLHMGATAYTNLTAAAGGGALIAAMYMATMASRSDRTIKRWWLLRSAFACSAIQIGLGFVRNYWIALAGVAAVGYLNLTFNNMANSTLQLNSTDEYRGRIMSVYSLVNNGTVPLGNMYAGVVMERLGGAMGFLFCGAANVLLMGLLVAIRPAAFKESQPALAASPGDGA